MQIKDFEYCATAVLECSTEGKILNKNPAAKKLLADIRKGAVLSFQEGIGSVDDKKYMTILHDGRAWLLFFDFLQFDFEGEVFPHAEEYMLLAGEEFLLLEAELSHLQSNIADNVRLARIRRMFFERFAFVFQNERNPARLYRIGTFFEYYKAASKKTYDKVGCRVRYDIRCDDSLLVINARNAAVLLTQLITFFVFHSTDGRTKVEADLVGDYLRVNFEARLQNVAVVCSANRELAALGTYYPENAIDLLAVDLIAKACHYTLEYDISEEQKISLQLYLKTENDVYALLDKAQNRNITKDMEKLIAGTLGDKTFLGQ
ncbi:MAG: hypothetical protein HFE77_00605 [Clostridiales bacterium]|nr:hypothetical protein [Clostridiales bacterium]